MHAAAIADYDQATGQPTGRGGSDLAPLTGPPGVGLRILQVALS